VSTHHTECVTLLCSVIFSIDTTRLLVELSNPERLTSVDIDACALKLGLDLTDERLLRLTRALAPGILRVGGTDQNNLQYDMLSREPQVLAAPFFLSSGRSH
jgi:hypothetical protein